MSERVVDLEAVKSPAGAGASAEFACEGSTRWNPFGFVEAQRDDHDAHNRSFLQLGCMRHTPHARRADTECRAIGVGHARGLSGAWRHLPCAVHGRTGRWPSRAAQGRATDRGRARGDQRRAIGRRLGRSVAAAAIGGPAGPNSRGGCARIALVAHAAAFVSTASGRVVPHLGGASGFAAGSHRIAHGPVVARECLGAGQRLRPCARGWIGFRHFDGGSRQ